MKQHILKKLSYLLLLVLSLSACGQKSPNIDISNAWIRPDPLWENAAGYFLATNAGNSNDTIVGITLDFAKFGIIHQTVIDDDIGKMILLTELDIPKGGAVEFKPLNYHIMITGLKDGLAYGDIVTIVFEFEKSGIIEVEAEIRNE